MMTLNGDVVREVESFRAHVARLRPQHIRKHDERYLERAAPRDALRFRFIQLARPATRTLRFVFSAAAATSRFHRAAKNASGRGLLRQVSDHLRLEWRYGLGGKYYYEFQLYDDKYSEQAALFLTDRDMDVALRTLYAVAYPEDGRILSDKFLFREHCRTHRLPSIPTIALFNDGVPTARRSKGEIDLPPQDLFSKPNDWWGGQKARRWRYLSDGSYQASGASVRYAPEELVAAVAASSRRRPMLLQPCISNHEEIRRLTGETLLCVRVITTRLPGEAPEPVIAYVAIPAGDAVVANFTQGNESLAASVDPNSGAIGFAFSKDIGDVRRALDAHPKTGRRIPGFRIPDWNAGRTLAVRAHHSLEKIACVGWDLAFTDEGPLLIEGNVVPGIESIQIAHQRPLGDTTLVRCLNAYLDAASFAEC